MVFTLSLFSLLLYLICFMKILNNIVLLSVYKLQSCGIVSCLTSPGIFLRGYLTLQTLLSSLTFSFISEFAEVSDPPDLLYCQIVDFFFIIGLKLSSLKIPTQNSQGFETLLRLRLY